MIRKKKNANWYSKLTEAEKQIWRLIYYHPTFIHDRTFALDMLFCVIGTGMKWKDGRIVDLTEDNYLTSTKQNIYNLDEDIYKKAFTNTFWKDGAMIGNELKASNIRQMREYNFSLNCIAEYTLKNIQKATTVAMIPKSFYPICAFSNLMTVPKDVKDGWLELAIETCDLILATDPLFRGSDNRLRNKNNIKLAKKQKVKLLKLRESLKGKRNE